MADEKRVRDIPDKERLRIVRDVSQLQTEIMLRFNTFMCEDVTRYDLTKSDIERFKASINYVMDEKFVFIERAIAEATNDGR